MREKGFGPILPIFLRLLTGGVNAGEFSDRDLPRNDVEGMTLLGEPSEGGATSVAATVATP